jgi:hypothetical protein
MPIFYRASGFSSPIRWHPVVALRLRLRRSKSSAMV